jgi:hypothetical protein
MHREDGLRLSDEEYDNLPRTGNSRKRDRENNNDDDFCPDKQQWTGLPSGTVSTITAGSDGVVGQIEDIGIKSKPGGTGKKGCNLRSGSA